MDSHASESYDFLSRKCMWVNGPIIVGAGPSGLAVAASLKEHGVPYVILERADCIASLWQKRTYDRLKLHLPKKFCQLPGLPFPESYPEYPCKKQFIDYLELYAKHFDICPRFSQSVQSARYDETSGLWRVKTVGPQNEEIEYIGRWLVVATGENAEKVVPEMEGLGSFGSQITHVCDYKSGKAYRGKKVLVVGCGNSGMEVCLDLCDHDASPSLVVRDSVHVLPREVCGKSTFELAVFLMQWLPLRLVDKIMLVLAWFSLGNMEDYGLKRPSTGPLELKNSQGRTPVLDVGALSKIKSGEIEVVPGVKRFLPGRVEFIDGQVLEFDAVIMATGYRSNVPYWLQGQLHEFYANYMNSDYQCKVVFPKDSIKFLVPEFITRDVKRIFTVGYHRPNNHPPLFTSLGTGNAGLVILKEYRAYHAFVILQGTDFFSKDGLPKAQFPNSWKGKSGLYAVGFTRRGLAGASADAVKVAKDLGEAWKEETKQAKRLVSCHRRCISQIY